MINATKITNQTKASSLFKLTSSYATKASTFVKEFLTSKQSSESIPYEDKTDDGKLISSTKVHYYYPTTTYKNFKHHKSLESLCTHIALTRNPAAKKTLKEETSNASFSAINRADLVTEVRISKGLKKLLGLQGKTDQEIKEFLSTESIYKHNSEFNGHSYIDHEGKLVELRTAIASSADRKAYNAQNLTVVKTGGKNLLYTGRPDVMEKAKEQALFIMSHKLNIPLLEEAAPCDTPSAEMPEWIKGTKGVTWNPKTKCIEFPYAIYSIMSDSDSMYAFYKLTGSWANNEKLFLKKELQTLEKLKKEPILIKDSSGKVFKMQCKPIFLSQGFNSFETIKGALGEGSLSPAIMRRGWKELKQLIQKNPAKAKKVEAHLSALESYFNGVKHLSNLHLFLHLNLVLSEINGSQEALPLVLHCKSSTDRTGIGAAILATLKQMKRLRIPIPADLDVLTKDVRFKELFALNWIPTWHQRSKYSRDVAGISFGSKLSQNPILLDCLPKRYLKESRSPIRWIGSGLFAGANFVGLGIYKYFNVNLPFTYDVLKHCFGLEPLSSQKLSDWVAVIHNTNLEYWKPAYYPKIFINKKTQNSFRSQGIALSPLEKLKKATPEKK